MRWRKLQFDSLTGEITGYVNHLAVFPQAILFLKIQNLESHRRYSAELQERVAYFEKSRQDSGGLHIQSENQL